MLGAARWALFAEAGVKWWSTAKQAAQTPLPPPGGDMKTFTLVGELRAQGMNEMNRLRPILFPEDDDG